MSAIKIILNSRSNTNAMLFKSYMFRSQYQSTSGYKIYNNKNAG